MNYIALLSIVVLSAIPLSLEAKSYISGIYFASLSADSTSYCITRKDASTEDAELSTDSSLSAKLGTIVYFPKKRLELIPFFKVRHQDYQSAKKDKAFYHSIDETQDLNSLGLEAKGELRRNIEWLGEIEWRQELGFTVDDATQTVSTKPYSNLKLSAGLKYNFYQAHRTEFGIQGKLAALTPFSSKDYKIGHLAELALVGFQKMGKKHSLQGDLFYETYQQDTEKLSIERQELGLRLSYVFRM